MSADIFLQDFLSAEEKADIAAGTYSINIYPKIVDAINAATAVMDGSGFYPAIGRVRLGKGRIRCDSTIELKKMVILEGEDSGLPSAEATVLKFPVNTNGIIVHRTNTIGDGIDSPSTTGGDGSIIRGLVLRGPGASSGSTGNGIWLRARAIVSNCKTIGFRNNGLQVLATATGGGAVEGNANNFAIRECQTINNGGHGLYVDGADVNAGSIYAVDSSGNAGWGIYDSSFLGNTYTACHTAENTLGAYKSDDPNAKNLFLGCYAESGQSECSIITPAMVVGGAYGDGFGSSTALIIGSDYTGGTFTHWQATAPDMQSTHIGVANGENLLEWWTDADAAGAHRYALAHRNTGYFQIDHAGLGARVGLVLYDSEAISANGFARTYDPGFLGIRDHYYVGDPKTAVKIDYGSAAPTTGACLIGDVRYNTAPAASGNIGWVCVTAGSPGTWKTFGAIAA